MRKQCKCPVIELSLSPMRNDQSPVRVATKIGKKLQGESNDQEKRKKIRPNEKVFNQYVSQTNGQDLEFELKTVESFNFDRVQKLTISVK